MAALPTPTLIGSSVEGGNPEAWERANGVLLPVFRTYFKAAGTSSLVARATADHAAGRVPLVSTKVPGSWDEVADGKQDAWLNTLIRGLAALGKITMLCVHHEPDGDGSAATWVRMQQKVRKAIDEHGQDKVLLVGILNGWSFVDPTPNQSVTDYKHPVGTGVHVLGYDYYDSYSANNPGNFRTVDSVVAIGKTIQSWGYPTLIGETGVRTDPRNPTRAPAWWSELVAKASAAKFVAVCYFNSGQNSPDGPWTLDGARLAVFVESVEACWVALDDTSTPPPDPDPEPDPEPELDPDDAVIARLQQELAAATTLAARRLGQITRAQTALATPEGE